MMQVAATDMSTDGALWRMLQRDLAVQHLARTGLTAGASTRGIPAAAGLLRTALTSPGWWQLVLHRLAHASRRRQERGGSATRARLAEAMRWPVAILLKLLTKNEIAERTVVEGGVWLSNRGGIVMGCHRVGSGTLIHHNVTIGAGLGDGGLPDIGRDVWIGHDSVVHGGIIVGEGTTILPGSILGKSVPPRAVVQGNPARVTAREFDNAPLRASPAEDPHLRPPGAPGPRMLREAMAHVR